MQLVIAERYNPDYYDGTCLLHIFPSWRWSRNFGIITRAAGRYVQLLITATIQINPNVPTSSMVVPFCAFSCAAILPLAKCKRQLSSRNHIGIFHCSQQNQMKFTPIIIAGLLHECFALLFIILIARRNFITCEKREKCTL